MRKGSGRLGVALILAAASAPAHAEILEGVFNTGPSRMDEARGSSLNIRFHPCVDDHSRSCASIVDTFEPNGVSGVTTLPDGSPIIGRVMITGLKSKSPGKYRSGKILAVDESVVKGEITWYGLKVDNNFDGTLTARGCLGFICAREMTWTLVTNDLDAVLMP